MNPHTLISSQDFNSIAVAFALTLIAVSAFAMFCGVIYQLYNHLCKPAPIPRPRNRRISPRSF